MKSILATHIPTSPELDEVLWLWKNNGQYDVKSGYWLHKNSQNPITSSSSSWNQLWKQNLSPKWKYFYWRLFHGALATGGNLRKRKILSERPCFFYGKEEESDTHIFRDCIISMHIWKASNRGINPGNPSVCSRAKWSKNWLWFLMNKKEDSAELVAKFVIVLWCIWNERNHLIFRENRVLSLQNKMVQMEVICRARWYTTYQKVSKSQIIGSISKGDYLKPKWEYFSKNWLEDMAQWCLSVDGA